MTPAQALDFAAVFVFGLSGALVASRAQLDPIGFLFLAALTGVGGGTVRDILLHRNPVFWIDEPAYIAVASVAALIVFFAAHRLESRYSALRWIDAVALSIAVAAGTSVARTLDASLPIIVLMGVATGTLGGLMRDVVANEVPMVLRKGELYLTAAFAGALACVLLIALLPEMPVVSTLAAAGVTFTLRAGSLLFGWRLPVYKPRAPRDHPPRS